MASMLALVRHVPAAVVLAASVLPAVAADTPTFVDNALPVLRQRCGSCHNPDKKTAGLDVTSYASILRGGGSGDGDGAVGGGRG